MKVLLRERFIALNAFIRKEERCKISHLIFYLIKLETEEQSKSKKSRRKEITIRVEINDIENRKSVEKLNKTRRWFFENINKIYKCLVR